MKQMTALKIAYLITLCLFFTACGGGAGGGSGAGSGGSGGGMNQAKCVHDAVRSWVEPTTGDVINLAEACTGTGLVCNSKFTYTQPDSNGMSTVTITETDSTPGCMTLGTHSCHFDLQNLHNGRYTGIIIECDGNGGTYYDAD